MKKTDKPTREMVPANSQGGFYSWADKPAGEKLCGTYAGTEASKFEGLDNFIMIVDDKPLKFTGSAGLQSLNKVKLGAYVEITHLGMQKSKNGRDYRSFDIQVEKGGLREVQKDIS